MSKSRTGFPVAQASAIMEMLSAVTMNWSASARNPRNGLAAGPLVQRKKYDGTAIAASSGGHRHRGAGTRRHQQRAATGQRAGGAAESHRGGRVEDVGAARPADQERDPRPRQVLEARLPRRGGRRQPV